MRLIQQVELFYYVARYGGISRAIRHLPYGLSQPAVSKQVGLLEEQVGCILFERGPFLLTPEGERLHAYSRSFFEGLNQTLTGLRADAPRIVRVASTPLILRSIQDMLRMRQALIDLLNRDVWRLPPPATAP